MTDLDILDAEIAAAKEAMTRGDFTVTFSGDVTAYLVAAVRERDELRAALVSLDNDWHPVSTRTCPTCGPIAELLGAPFGCVRYRTEHPGDRHTYDMPPRAALHSKEGAS